MADLVHERNVMGLWENLFLNPTQHVRVKKKKTDIRKEDGKE